MERLAHQRAPTACNLWFTQLWDNLSVPPQKVCGNSFVAQAFFDVLADDFVFSVVNVGCADFHLGGGQLSR